MSVFLHQHRRQHRHSASASAWLALCELSSLAPDALRGVYKHRSFAFHWLHASVLVNYLLPSWGFGCSDFGYSRRFSRHDIHDSCCGLQVFFWEDTSHGSSTTVHKTNRYPAYTKFCVLPIGVSCIYVHVYLLISDPSGLINR